MRQQQKQGESGGVTGSVLSFFDRAASGVVSAAVRPDVQNFWLFNVVAVDLIDERHYFLGMLSFSKTLVGSEHSLVVLFDTILNIPNSHIGAFNNWFSLFATPKDQRITQ